MAGLRFKRVEKVMNPFSYTIFKDGEVVVRNSGIELEFRDQAAFLRKT